jgi:hypothetical protein
VLAELIHTRALEPVEAPGRVAQHS